MERSFGYDTSSLTEAEARYLTRFNSLDSLRNQIAATGQAASGGSSARGTGAPGSGEKGEAGQPSSAAPAADKPQYSLRDDGRDVAQRERNVANLSLSLTRPTHKGLEQLRLLRHASSFKLPRLQAR
jgi:hypothetical protein